MAAIVALADDAVPPAFEARLRDAVAAGGPARGSTALRPSAPRGWRHPIPWASALAAAAVVGLIVFAGLPRFGAPATLSASEILGRSLQTLTGVRGVEQLEYELVFTGYSGPHRIEQLLDHEHPNRYRIADFGPDGVMQSAISEDSVAGPALASRARRRAQLHHRAGGGARRRRSRCRSSRRRRSKRSSA